MCVTRNRRAVGADPEALSGGAYSRRSSGAQADPGAQSSRCSAVDSQYWRSVAHASAVLPELKDSAPALSAVVGERSDSRGAHGFGQYSSRSRGAGRVRVLHRCHVCLGQGRWGSDWTDATRKRRELREPLVAPVSNGAFRCRPRKNGLPDLQSLSHRLCASIGWPTMSPMA